ncbi:MAG: hypothetical protein ACM3UP_00795 [Methanocella sp.]
MVLLRFSSQWIKKLCVLAVASACLGMLTLPALAGVSLQVQPARCEFMVAPGRPYTSGVTVSNDSPVELRLVATVADWTLDAQGGMATLPGGDASTARWVRFNPREFRLGPGKSQVVRFTVTAPPGASPGEHRSAIFFRATGDPPKGAEIEAVVTFAVAVPLYANVPVIKRTAKLDPLVVNYTADKGLQIETKITGTGNAHFRFNPVFEVRDMSGRIAAAGSLDRVIVLPGQTVTARGNWQGVLPPGVYAVEAKFKFEAPLYTRGLLFEYDYEDQKGKSALTASASFTVAAKE